MEIFLHKSAEKFLNKLDTALQKNIKEDLKKLAENPYSNYLDIKKLKGLKNKPDLFRLRSGRCRIIYFIQEDKIWVTEILTREQSYGF